MNTIRDHLDHFVGRTVVDVTSHDPTLDDPERAHITLLFDDGAYIRFPLGDDGVDWGTVNDCLEHIGCIAGEARPPDPGVLLEGRVSHRLTRARPRIDLGKPR